MGLLIQPKHFMLMLIFIIFSLPIQMYRNGCCTTPGIGIGCDLSFGGGVGIRKISRFYVNFLCDGQGAVRRTFLYTKRSC